MLASLDPTIVVPIALALLTVVAFTLVITATVTGPASRRYKRRLRTVTGRKQGPAAAGGAANPRSLSRRESATPTMDRFARRWLPRRDLLAQRLERTGRTITIGQYFLVSLGLCVISAALALLFVPVGPVGAVLAGLADGIMLPHFLVGRMGKKRIARFLALFPEAIDLMVRALRSGLPISEAIINAAHEIGDPVGAEFRTIEAGLRLGRDLDSLLWDIAKRIDAPEYKFFIIALAVQRETGGNLAETLANLSDVLRRRRTMRKKARAMASEARATASILGSLPILVTIVLMMTSPKYIMLLFTDPRGLVLCALAVAMLVTGISIMVKLARFDI